MTGFIQIPPRMYRGRSKSLLSFSLGVALDGAEEVAGGSEETDFFADADYEAHDAADDASDEGGEAAGAFVEEFEERDHDDEAEGDAQAEDSALGHADFRGALDGGEHGEGEEVAFFM